MKLYKYLKFEDALKTLDNNSVILNNPVNYNDPFDCVIKPSKEDEEICYKRILNYYMFKEFSNIILDKKVKIPFWLLWVRWELKLFIKLMRKNPYYDKMPGFDGIMTIVFNKYATAHKDFKKELELKKIEFSKNIKKAIEAKILSDKEHLSALLKALSEVEEATVREIPALMKDDCEKIILYGSFARGDYTLDSDVDIAVLTKSDREKSKRFDSGIDEIAAEIGVKTMMIVNYICLPIKEFEAKKSWYPFFMNIAGDGRVLYDIRNRGVYA